MLLPIYKLADKIPLEDRLVIIQHENNFKSNKDSKALDELFKFALMYLEETDLDPLCSGCRERIFNNWNKIVYHWTSNE